ncbi:MAG: ribbon-helix-helix protein, CopG family [Planctomycetota bacterium]
MKKKSVRLNLTLTPEAKKRLEKIQRETEADTLTEVIRKAIRLYEIAIERSQNGSRLVLKSDDSEQELLVL